MTSPPETVLVLCTCPPGDVAQSLAGRLVAEGHAACVNRIQGIVSTYRWQDDLKEDDETLLLIKTSLEKYPALERRLVEIHPYELPEIIAVPITTGLPAYLEWVAGGAG